MIEKVKKVMGYRLFLPLSCLLIVLFINLVTTPIFFKISTTDGVLCGYIIGVISRAGELVVLAVGITLVVSASAGMDISVGVVMVAAASVCTHVLVGEEVSANEYANPYVLTVLAGLAVAVLRGYFSGFLIAKPKIQSMIAALIPSMVGRGIPQLVTNGQITHIRVNGCKLLNSNVPGIPIPTPVFVVVLVVVFTHVLPKKTTMGMYAQAVGTNEQTSRLVGLKSTKIIWMTYAFCGLCVGIAKLVASSRIYSVNTNNIGLSMELDAIAAMTLGENSLGGRKFSLLGSVIDTYTIQVLTTVLYAMNVPLDQIPMYKVIVVIIAAAVQSEELKKFKKCLMVKHTSKTAEGGVTQ